MEWILGLINSTYILLFYVHGNRLREITLVNLAQKSESAPTAGFHSQLLSVLCLYNVNEFQNRYRECVCWVNERNQEHRLKYYYLRRRVVIREELGKLVFGSITRARSMKRLSYNLRIIQDLSFQTLRMVGSELVL